MHCNMISCTTLLKSVLSYLNLIRLTGRVLILKGFVMLKAFNYAFCYILCNIMAGDKIEDYPYETVHFTLNLSW